MKSCVDQLHSVGDLQRLQDEAFVSDKQGYSVCSLKEGEEKVLSENGQKVLLLGIVFLVALKIQEKKKFL